MASSKMEIRRAAIGRTAQLGDLYNFRSDAFCGVNLFNKDPPSTAIKLVNNEASDIDFLEGDILSEKFMQLEVEPELRLSFSSGLCSVDGAGLFLTDNKSSARTLKNALFYHILTKVEQLDLFDDELLDTVSLDALNDETATHIVVEVFWGANTIISFEHADMTSSELQEIKELQTQMSALAISASDGDQVKLEKINKKRNNGISLKIFGDMLPTGNGPQTIESALALMKEVPFLVKNSNSGKGKPISYVMASISILRDYRNQRQVPDVLVFNAVDENILLQFEELFDELQRAKEHLNDFYLDVIATDEAIPDNCRNDITNLQNDFLVEEEKLRFALKATLVEVRSGNVGGEELNSLLNEYECNQMSPKNMLTTLQQFSSLGQKLALKNVLKKEGVHYVKRNSAADTIIAQNQRADVYILYYNEALQAQNEELWQTTWQAFLRLTREQPATASFDRGHNKTVFIFVDQKGKPGSPSTEKLSIKHVQGRTVLSKDLVTDHAATSHLCIAKSWEPLDRSTAKPSQRVHIEFCCPGSYSKTCEDEPCIWLCHKCQETLEFGFDSYLYCSCGRANYKSFSYKCRSPSHGFSFFTFEPKILEKVFASLQPLKELNILILGETGVGKSTWINGFVNYLTYSTLAEAEQGDNVNLIPATFTMTDEDYEEITISTGAAKNENTAAGQSATQHPNSYVFTRGKNLVRLIDTPGIGDTRGIDQDKKNFQYILTHISRLEEIHGICILLKPNNSRLTVMFQFCVKELLTHLHRDASRNIVFCFTNARSTFYQPGDTLPPLRKLLADNKQVSIPLNKQTIYCVDNESVRFLAALKHGLKFDNSMRQNYSASWDKSVEETDRLIRHIDSLEPHKTRNTLSLNEARRIIVAMTEPLAVIGRNIDDNIAVVKDKQMEIQLSKNSKEELVGKLYVPVIDLEPVELDYPRTVCTSANCIKVYDVDGNTKTEYAQICHPHCYLNDVEVGQYPCSALQRCWAFNGAGANCRACECTWEKHMHITYEYKQVEVHVTDNTVQELINGKIDVIRAVEETMRKLEDQIEALYEEKSHVLRVSSKFAHFLKANAITPYNDAMEEYLLMLIRQEKDKIAVGGDRKALQSLEEMLAAYKEEVAILEAAINSSCSQTTDTIRPDDIATLAASLYQLPISGKTFEKYMAVMEGAAANNAQYNEVRYQPPRTFKEKNSSATWNKTNPTIHKWGRGKQPKPVKEWTTIRSRKPLTFERRENIQHQPSKYAGAMGSVTSLHRHTQNEKPECYKQKMTRSESTPSKFVESPKGETGVVKKFLNYLLWR